MFDVLAANADHGDEREWQNLNLDTVIFPGFSFPALPLEAIDDALGRISVDKLCFIDIVLTTLF